MTIKSEEDFFQGYVVCNANRRIIIRGSNQGQFFCPMFSERSRKKKKEIYREKEGEIVREEEISSRRYTERLL